MREVLWISKMNLSLKCTLPAHETSIFSSAHIYSRLPWMRSKAWSLSKGTWLIARLIELEDLRGNAIVNSCSTFADTMRNKRMNAIVS